ncbi:MAG: hormogonium polysaccharide biosynthesis protein HpsA, partial [Cyanobacteria bacterium P01_C01_bin.72]
PDGRFVNEPLRNAMLQRRAGKTLSMADNSAIDTAICAIRILNGATPNDSKIPHGTIYETSFLDSRQIKSIEKTPNLVATDPQYKLSLEQRQAFEVRVTVLDLNKLRQKKIGAASATQPQEYLLPNSGIIYATRDDALLDLSQEPGTNQNRANDQKKNINRRKLISPTDYKLDSTRRPNGIMLINGERLDRERKYRDEEKGLILATNVPAYIKGDFNLHVKGGDPKNKITSGMKLLEEFEEELRNPKTGEIDWKDFYKRAKLNKNFACRINDPRLPECKDGDSWRPATVLADAVTVLSDNFRFGFRNEGDYELRNNAGNAVVTNYDFDGNGSDTDILSERSLKVDLNGDGDKNDISVSEANQIGISAVRRKLGFFENNFLTSANWFEASGNIDSVTKDFQPTVPGNQEGSSYVNNFVTPIQRRVLFGEYLMEVCPKIPVHTCEAADWSVNGEKVPASQKKATGEIGQAFNPATHKAGTTAANRLATPDLQRYARRLAFARNQANGNLVLDDRGQPVPLGIDASGNIQAFPRNKVAAEPSWNVGLPEPAAKALWFRTTDKNTGKPGNSDINYGNQRHLFYETIDGRSLKGTDPNEQPLLVPVLQIHMPNDNWTKASGNPGGNRADKLPDTKDRGVAKQRNWLQKATTTT